MLYIIVDRKHVKVAPSFVATSAFANHLKVVRVKANLCVLSFLIVVQGLGKQPLPSEALALHVAVNVLRASGVLLHQWRLLVEGLLVEDLLLQGCSYVAFSSACARHRVMGTGSSKTPALGLETTGFVPLQEVVSGLVSCFCKKGLLSLPLETEEADMALSFC